MHTLKDVIFFHDVYNLPKQVLVETCKALNIPAEGKVSVLAQRLWASARENTEVKEVIANICKEEILAGRTSSSWFTSSTDAIKNIKNLVVDGGDFDPFSTIRHPNVDSLGEEPVLIAAANGDVGGKYIFRYMFKNGDTKELLEEQVTTRPRLDYATLLVNEADGFLEVRAEHKTAIKIANSFSRLIRQEKTIGPVSVLGKYGHNTEKLADALGGRLFDMVAKPGQVLKNFSVKQAASVVKILVAVDTYFRNENFSILRKELDQARNALGDEFSTATVTALILNGMEKVSFGTGEIDLRNNPLYEFLKTNLEQSGNMIRFPVPGLGEYTIRVGIKSDNIVFQTSASEKVIDYVRSAIL